MSLLVRRLTPEDLDAYVALRRHALVAAPSAFGSSPEDDHSFRPQAVEEMLRGESPYVMFGGFIDDVLVGKIGVGISAKIKRRHRAELVGTFVSEHGRGQGLGSALLEAAVEHARQLGATILVCEVSHDAGPARALYAKHGFQVYGTDPASLEIDGQWIPSDLLWLRLSSPGVEL